MARPARVNVEEGIYHVISRGTERCDLFKVEADYAHFIDRLAEAQRRFRLRVYGYALMRNHFHLMVCTPDANLSRAIQWLKVSYSMWFNAKYKRVGPLFQGRFKGILVDSDAGWLLDLSLYVHLNPVRIQKYRQGKADKQLEAEGRVIPSAELVQARLNKLRSYRWSSYRCYAGYKPGVPEWLDVDTIRRRAGSASAYRQLAERRITSGFDEGFISALKDRLALGGVSFVERVRGMCDPKSDYEAVRELRHRCGWEEIVAAVEQVRGCCWADFANVRGDWGRACVYYFARRVGGLTLAEIGDAAGGVKYSAVSKMIQRFESRAEFDDEVRDAIRRVEGRLNV